MRPASTIPPHRAAAGFDVLAIGAESARTGAFSAGIVAGEGGGTAPHPLLGGGAAGGVTSSAPSDRPCVLLRCTNAHGSGG